MKNFILGFSHTLLEILLIVFYFELRPSDFSLINDVVFFIGLIGFIVILLNISFSLKEISEKLTK